MSHIDEVCQIIDDRTLSWSRPVTATPARLWRALTDEAEMAIWFMESRLDLREGGEARFHLADPFGGTITRLEPERLLEVEYDTGAGDGFIRFEIEPGRVRLTERMQSGETPEPDWGLPTGAQPGGPGTHWAGVAAGWHGCVDALVAHLEGRPLPSPEDYEALTADYADWLRARFEG